MAGETMVGFTKEQIEWFRNESKLKYELDRRAMIAEARDEAREEAREEARDEFLEEGRKEGREEGIAIGETREAERNRKETREKTLRAARNLKQLGLSDEQIASALDLRAEELKAL